jgi:hypothetical protein
MSDEDDYNFDEVETADADTPQYSDYFLLRNGIKTHIQLGKFTAITWTVYSSLLLWANWKSGIYFGTPKDLQVKWDYKLTEPQIWEALYDLRKRGYINFRQPSDPYRNFRILINKFEPTCGEHKGKRLNAFSSIANPVYEDFDAKAEGYCMLDNYLRNDICSGSFTPVSWAIYCTCRIWVDFAEGHWHGNAGSICTLWRGQLSIHTVRKCMLQLRESKFIHYENPLGTRGQFNIKIHNIMITDGVKKGTRLNAWK